MFLEGPLKFVVSISFSLGTAIFIYCQLLFYEAYIFSFFLCVDSSKPVCIGLETSLEYVKVVRVNDVFFNSHYIADTLVTAHNGFDFAFSPKSEDDVSFRHLGEEPANNVVGNPR